MRAARALILLATVTLLGVIALLVAMLWPASNSEPGLRFSGVSDGGGYRLVIPGTFTPDQTERLKRLIGARLEEVDERFSPKRADSEVGRLARAPLGEAVPISAGLASVIGALYAARELSGGAYAALSPTPLSAWWQPQSPALEWVDRFVWHPPGPSALLSFDDRALPFVPARLAVDRLIGGIGADALADALDGAGVERYRIEVQGSVRVRGGPWPFALDGADLLSLDHAAVAWAQGADGTQWLVIAHQAQAARLTADILAAVDAQSAFALAQRHGWAVRSVNGAGRVRVSSAFDRVEVEQPTMR